MGPDAQKATSIEIKSMAYEWNGMIKWGIGYGGRVVIGTADGTKVERGFFVPFPKLRDLFKIGPPVQRISVWPVSDPKFAPKAPRGQ